MSVSADLPVSVERAWAAVADLGSYVDWLSLLEDWRGDVPELAPGAEISAVVKTKGFRNRVTFVIRNFDPPHAVTLDGHGIGGTKVSLAFRLSGSGDSSKLEFDVDFHHPALKGPMRNLAGRTIKGELQTSMVSFSKAASI